MAKKTIYFEKLCGFSVTAVTEDGKITDCKFQQERDEVAVGNIYKGIVANVIAGMQAAFIDCGLERNCYLSAEDLPHGAEELSYLKTGDEIIVQIVKLPAGKKGAKVTAKLSFVGMSLIYLPNTDFVGISHRLEDTELRESLIMAAKRAKKKGEGLVIRNAAPFCSYKQIAEELKFLRRVYEKTAATFRKAKPGTLLFTDFTMPVRVMREFTEFDVDGIIVGNAEQYEELKAMLEILPGGKNIRLVRYEGKRFMLEETGILTQLREIFLPRVDIESGAYLIIEHTEALTSIDVNTGSFTGGDDFEYTVYQTNLAAAREIARQVKLRNIGGIIVVDFIDMESPAHRKAIGEELEKALKPGRAPYKVLPMSDFGLIEFTRKRLGDQIASFFVRPCRTCGAGTEFTREYYVIAAISQTMKALSGGAEAVCMSVRPEAAKILESDEEFKAELKKRVGDAAVYVLADESKGNGEGNCFICKKETPPRGAVQLQ